MRPLEPLTIAERLQSTKASVGKRRSRFIECRVAGLCSDLVGLYLKPPDNALQRSGTLAICQMCNTAIQEGTPRHT
ncbi:hypothetical protein CIW54_26620 [Paraburkholderia sp. T12-10]|nr:hypothetical protein CIW54_26620 [Paraburkholderia sp. T12-10]